MNDNNEIYTIQKKTSLSAVDPGIKRVVSFSKRLVPWRCRAWGWKVTN